MSHNHCQTIDGQVRLGHLICLQTDNFHCFFVNKWTNYKLPFPWWANGKWIKEKFPWASVFHSNGNICIYIYIHIKIRYWHKYIFIYLFLYLYIFHYLYRFSIYMFIWGKRNQQKKATSICLLQTENRSGKLPFVFCKRKTEVFFSLASKQWTVIAICCFSKRTHLCVRDSTKTAFALLETVSRWITGQ